MVTPNTPQRPGTVTDLINQLLDRGYNSTAQPVLNAIANTTQSGLIKTRLAQLDEEARRLIEAGEKLTPDNPVLRALLADMDDALRGSASLLSSAGDPLQNGAIDAAGKLQRQLALPGMTDTQLASIGIAWNSPDPQAIARLVDYIQTQEFADMLAAFPEDVIKIIQNQAIRGIALGWNPLHIAREITRVAENFPRYLANNLLRTLQLTAYRDATALHQNANRDIASQVVRIAALDARTCMSCIALHGQVLWDTEIDPNAPVPRVDDHHSGRCTSVMIIKGRRHNIQTGPDWWNSLSPERQAQQNSLLRSPGKLEALRSGQITLEDLIHPYTDPVFGDMIREASLSAALKPK